MVFPQPTNLSSINEAFAYSNNVSEGLFIILIPVCVWIIITLFLALRGFRFTDCAVSAGFTVFVVSIFLFWSGLYPMGYLALTILVAFLIPLIGSYIQRE